MTGWDRIRVLRSLLNSESSSRTVHLGQVQPQHPTHHTIRCNDLDANLLARFKVTFSDIRKRIEAYFNSSLSHRKNEIRKLIENAITDMMERNEEEEESEYSENDA